MFKWLAQHPIVFIGLVFGLFLCLWFGLMMVAYINAPEPIPVTTPARATE